MPIISGNLFRENDPKEIVAEKFEKIEDFLFDKGFKLEHNYNPFTGKEGNIEYAFIKDKSRKRSYEEYRDYLFNKSRSEFIKNIQEFKYSMNAFDRTMWGAPIYEELWIKCFDFTYLKNKFDNERIYFRFVPGKYFKYKNNVYGTGSVVHMETELPKFWRDIKKAKDSSNMILELYFDNEFNDKKEKRDLTKKIRRIYRED